MIFNPILPGGGGQSGFREFDTYGAFAAELKNGKRGVISVYCMGMFHILFDFSVRTTLMNTVVKYNSSDEYTIVSGLQLDILIIRRGDQTVCTLMDLTGSVEPELVNGYTLKYTILD